MTQLIQNLFALQSLELSETNDTKGRIAELRATVPPQILAHYDRLLARGKKGVSLIHGQVCSACHMTVPRNTILILMNGTDIQICGNCGRYLALPEHAHPAVPAAKNRKRAAKPALVEAT